MAPLGEGGLNIQGGKGKNREMNRCKFVTDLEVHTKGLGIRDLQQERPQPRDRQSDVFRQDQVRNL